MSFFRIRFVSRFFLKPTNVAVKNNAFSDMFLTTYDRLFAYGRQHFFAHKATLIPLAAVCIHEKTKEVTDLFLTDVKLNKNNEFFAHIAMSRRASLRTYKRGF